MFALKYNSTIQSQYVDIYDCHHFTKTEKYYVNPTHQQTILSILNEADTLVDNDKKNAAFKLIQCANSFFKDEKNYFNWHKKNCDTSPEEYQSYLDHNQISYPCEICLKGTVLTKLFQDLIKDAIDLLKDLDPAYALELIDEHHIRIDTCEYATLNEATADSLPKGPCQVKLYKKALKLYSKQAKYHPPHRKSSENWNRVSTKLSQVKKFSPSHLNPKDWQIQQLTDQVDRLVKITSSILGIEESKTQTEQNTRNFSTHNYRR